jgi:hypothetical protein
MAQAIGAADRRGGLLKQRGWIYTNDLWKDLH